MNIQEFIILTILQDAWGFRTFNIPSLIKRLCADYPDDAGQEGMLEHLLEMALFKPWPVRGGNDWLHGIVANAIEMGALPKEDHYDDC